MVKRILLALGIVLLAIQVYRPGKNISPQPPGAEDFIVRFNPPAAVREILQTTCYDCHSDTTRYPWYAEVQPVAWWLARHIDEGKDELNFSRFGAYAAKLQAKKLNAISQELVDRKMPLRSYTWIHANARLSESQIQTMSEWMDALHDRISPVE